MGAGEMHREHYLERLADLVTVPGPRWPGEPV
jgi:hypothetical protein